MILLIDNYDSFVWNLEHALRLAAPRAGVDATVRVFRHDAIDAERVESLAPSHIVLSPGPCGPAEAGVCIDLVRTHAGRVPVLGVCLGHQAIAAAFGMDVRRGATPVHGKAWAIEHDGKTLFAGLPSPMRVGRYHSLVVEPGSVPDGWDISARTKEGVVMGLRRAWNDPRTPALEGVQFHPESYLTDRGVDLLTNFLRGAPQSASPAPAPSDTIAAAR
ncbi:MAG: anthranilate synthase component II [Phycisphaerales bacterium]